MKRENEKRFQPLSPFTFATEKKKKTKWKGEKALNVRHKNMKNKKVYDVRAYAVSFIYVYFFSVFLSFRLDSSFFILFLVLDEPHWCFDRRRRESEKEENIPSVGLGSFAFG